MSESMSTATPSKPPNLSLDQVFQRTATKITDQSPTKSRIRLTPLSKKACLIHGIDPSALQNREYASFARPGLDPEIQTMHYEVYLHTREKLMELASTERSKLKQHMEASSMESGDSGTIGTLSLHGLDEEGGRDQIENEKRRLEKVARRQQKELLRMLAFESKSAAINEKMKKRADEQVQRELQREKEKRQRDLKAAEEARIRELRKKADEEREAHLQRLKMQQQFERDKKIQQQKAMAEKEQKKRARAEEQMRAKKQELYEMQTKRILEKQQREIEQKMKERNAKERAKEEKGELKRLVDAQVAEAKRKEAQERIEANLKAARTKEEEKRAALLDKQSKHDEMMARIKQEKITEMQKQQEQNAAMERKRKKMLQMARKKEEALKDDVKSKIEKDEARRIKQQEELERENALRKAERDILMDMKRDNLNRIKRQQAYQQQETLKKVALNDKKSAEMKKKKEELIALRKKNAHEAKIKKDQLMAILDQTRGSGGSSTKIKKLLAKLGVSQPPQNKSKQDDSGTVKTEQSVITDIGPPPEIPSSLRMRLQKNVDNTAQPYQSPYATQHFVMDDLNGLKNLSLME
ncbi:hypothetical protein ACHAXN_008005 [Cyclotella atomus]